MAALTPADLVFRSQRRRALRASPALTGLEFIAVHHAGGERWQLDLHFVPPAPELDKDPIPSGLRREHFHITLDGAADPEVSLEAIGEPDREAAVLPLVVRRETRVSEEHHADEPVYTLAIEGVAALDPFFTAASFRFRPGRWGERLATPAGAHGLPAQRPEIDYLAKDYESFRRLMLERMAVGIHSWSERNPADLGVAVVEVLAYAADALSYHQDAVATEAYLRTARRRISLRRHARLLDYRLHEGCNARVWVQIGVSAEVELPAGTAFLTTSELLPTVLLDPSPEFDEAVTEGLRFFESKHPARLLPEHNEPAIHTWGSDDYRLPAGATEAALVGHLPDLSAEDVLILEEALGAGSTAAGDAHSSHRHAVRLVAPPRLDRDELTGDEITLLRWHDSDALPFPLVVSARLGSRTVRGITRALGNVILADHGRTLPPEPLPRVGVERWYRPVLRHREITHRQPPGEDHDALRGAAHYALTQDPVRALPALTLFSYPEHSAIPPEQRRPPRGERWSARESLLSSGRFARDFVVEFDDEQRAQLRFGDGLLGSRPAAGTEFFAVYRVGNGSGGNLGPDHVAHVVLDASRSGLAEHILAVRSPLAAAGGVEPQDADQARFDAPQAIHTQARCVTAADFEDAAEAYPGVLRARCRRRWTGSRETACLYLQRPGGRRLDDDFRRRVSEHLEPRMMLGSELTIEPPRWVPLHVGLSVLVAEHHFRERIRRLLEERLLRLFEPDDLAFGEPVHLSRIIAAASAVEGVTEIDATAFHRWSEPQGDELERGQVDLGELEIALLRNSPDRPQEGTLSLALGGGR